jgi:protein-S-isoprenylcysteine O-methyltransferase Ste14
MLFKTTLETKIPPPVYGLITALLIWWLASVFPSLKLLPAWFKQMGIALIVIGVCLDLMALRQFYKQKTTPNPLSPNKANTIVISGLYRFSRNPMYLGLLLSLTGWTMYLGNLASLACLPVFVWVLNNMQIKPEEHALEKKFGESYTRYLSEVRRWL